METKGVYLWLLGLLALAASAGCLETVVGEAGVCIYAGKGYQAGDDFAASDGCNTCSCAADGSVACTDIACAEDPSTGDLPPPADAGQSAVCTYGGMTYKLGAMFRHVDGCGGCTCGANGAVSCKLVACPRDAAVDASQGPTLATCMHGGKLYQAGDSFPDEDGCNKCRCSDTGVVECTLLECSPVCQYQGKTYKVGEVLPESDAESCYCGMLGMVSCQKKCSYEGKTFASGASFPASDGCNSCSCNQGAVSCTEKACSTATCTLNGRTYKQGETFYDAQRCNECTCTASGGVTCTARVCDPSDSCSFGTSDFANTTTILCPDGCNNCICNKGTWASTDAACPAPARIEVCKATDQDRIKASLLYQAQHVVALDVHQADCMAVKPNFKLCWDGTFKESNPVQVELYAVPIVPPSCSTWISRQIVFDLTPMADAYKMMYQSSSGLIVLNAYGASQNYVF